MRTQCKDFPYASSGVLFLMFGVLVPGGGVRFPRVYSFSTECRGVALMRLFLCC